MTDPTPSRPLWEVVQLAYPPPEKILKPSLDNLYRQIVAAELRAIAAAIRDHDDLCDSSAVDVALWLDDQADRAETGGC
jgi:hypothetical protein